MSTNSHLLPHPYTHINQISEETNRETLQAVFTQGRCHIYAAELLKLNPQLSLQATYRQNQIQHIYCTDSSGAIYDATGTYANLETYKYSNPLNMFIKTEYRTITLTQINKLIENKILTPFTQESSHLAQQTIKINKQHNI